MLDTESEGRQIFPVHRAGTVFFYVVCEDEKYLISVGNENLKQKALEEKNSSPKRAVPERAQEQKDTDEDKLKKLIEEYKTIASITMTLERLDELQKEFFRQKSAPPKERDNMMASFVVDYAKKYEIKVNSIRVFLYPHLSGLEIFCKKMQGEEKNKVLIKEFISFCKDMKSISK